MRSKVFGEPGSLGSAASDVAVEGVDPEKTVSKTDRVIVVWNWGVEEKVDVILPFMISTGGNDGDHPPVFSSGELPIIQPLAPTFCGRTADHVAAEADEQRPKFGGCPISALACIAVVATVSTSGEGKTAFTGRGSFEPKFRAL